jgi:hypothetical protein
MVETSDKNLVSHIMDEVHQFPYFDTQVKWI